MSLFLANSSEQDINFVDKCVEISLTDNDHVRGVVYTVDPVTGNFVTISKGDDSSISLTFTMQHAISDIQVESEKPDLTVVKTTSAILMHQAKQNLTTGFTKEHVENWLTLNKVPFTVTEEDIFIEGAKLISPYRPEDCIHSANPIIFARVQKLLHNLASSSKIECVI